MPVTANIGHVSHANDMPLKTIDIRVLLFLHFYIKSMNLLQTFNKVVSIIGNETGSVTDASGDVMVMSSECREVDKGSLYKIRMWDISPLSELKVHYKPTVFYFVRGCLSPAGSSRLLPTYAYTFGKRRKLVSHRNVSRLCVRILHLKLTRT